MPRTGSPGVVGVQSGRRPLQVGEVGEDSVNGVRTHPDVHLLVLEMLGLLRNGAHFRDEDGQDQDHGKHHEGDAGGHLVVALCGQAEHQPPHHQHWQRQERGQRHPPALLVVASDLEDGQAVAEGQYHQDHDVGVQQQEVGSGQHAESHAVRVEAQVWSVCHVPLDIDHHLLRHKKNEAHI